MLRRGLRALPLILAVTAQAETMAVDMLVYPNAGIFDINGSHLSGRGAVMLQRLQAASGVQLNQQLVPIPRALLNTLNKPGTCVVALPRTPDRETQYRWAGPWTSSAFALYARADDTRRVNGPQDLRGAQIAALRESLPAAWLEEHGLSGHEVNDAATGLRMLQAGRVDFWLGNDMAARFVIKTLGGAAPRPLYSFGRIELHVACHPTTPAALIGRLQAGIEQLRRRGQLAEFGLP